MLAARNRKGLSLPDKANSMFFTVIWTLTNTGFRFWGQQVSPWRSSFTGFVQISTFLWLHHDWKIMCSPISSLHLLITYAICLINTLYFECGIFSVVKCSQDWAAGGHCVNWALWLNTINTTRVRFLSVLHWDTVALVKLRLVYFPVYPCVCLVHNEVVEYEVCS